MRTKINAQLNLRAALEVLSRLFILIILLGVSTTFDRSAFADVGGAGRPLTGKVFTFRVRDEPESLDWHKAHTSVEAYLLMNLMEGLVSLDSSLNPIPALAESWTSSPDGKVYTFKIRSPVYWSDGTLLKAQDFVYGWKRLLSRMTSAPYAYLLFDIVGAEDFNNGKIQDFEQVGIKAPDDNTLQVTLARPVANWIFIPTFWPTFPLRQDVVEPKDIDLDKAAEWDRPGRMLSVGPYVLDSHDYDSKFVLKPNPFYYRATGNVDRIEALIIRDDSAAVAMFDAGKVDLVTDLSGADQKMLRARKDLSEYPQLKTGFLEFLTDRFPASSVNFRRAVAMAIDKKKLCQSIKGFEPASTFIPKKMMGYSPGIGLPFDLARAKAEFKASGADVGGEVTIDYLHLSWDKEKQIADFIQSELKKNLGINVKLNPFDNKGFRVQLGFGKFPVFDLTWTADYPDPDNYLSVFISSSGNSRTSWKNEKYDQKVAAARQILDPAVRLKEYLALQKTLLADEAVIVPLYYESALVLAKPYVKNFELNPMDYLYLKQVSIGNQ